eukprot:TRINITY_DN6633_c0_g2_i1.p1 TRINITY_DN6633_c0_g2~~TRINITY_DN6633_c0_g2_i1.p1  ORF type:complete len:435 (+),score=77.98 TRINITY_DN6633_c0_g2_i1:184-1305(+)
MKDALKISQDYAALLALTVRQVFGAVEITISAPGTFRDDDVIMYMKEISSDGNINTVDVIMPSHPLFLYLNPAMVGYLLKPLFDFQAQAHYPNPWAMHDMGANFPNATGHPTGNDEPMPIEESGNMILMALSHARFSQDQSLLHLYYPVMRQWAVYLVNNTLIPGNQLATTDAAGPLANQTNLAVKGIIAVGAMAKIAEITNNTMDATYFGSVAHQYIVNWTAMAVSDAPIMLEGGLHQQQHVKLDYQNSSTWGIQFNLYMDVLLQLDIVPKHIYNILDDWYPTVSQQYGVQLDTRVTWGKTDWNMWCAGASSSPKVRDLFVSSIMEYLVEGTSAGPLPDRYSVINAMPEGTRARPTVGAHFSLLALSLTKKD